MKCSWQLLGVLLLIGSLSLGGCASSDTPEPESPAESQETTAAPATDSEYRPILVCPEVADTSDAEGPACKAIVEMVIQSDNTEVNGKTIRVELNGDDAPVTSGNFVDLVSRGVYDGTAFHRVVREPEPFVVQGGDPAGKDTSLPLNALGRGGFTDPDTGIRRDVPLEIKLANADKPTYGQAGLDPSSVVLKHSRGAIAMARSQAPNSASAQFYFSLAPNDFLNGNYAVFGEVLEGMDVIDQIQMGDRIQSAQVVEGEEFLVK